MFVIFLLSEFEKIPPIIELWPVCKYLKYIFESHILKQEKKNHMSEKYSVLYYLTILHTIMYIH